MLLLVGATLLARSFVRLTHVDAGYTPARVLTAEVFVPGPSTPERSGRDDRARDARCASAFARCPASSPPAPAT